MHAIRIKKEKISARAKEQTDRNMMPRAGTWHSLLCAMMGPVITLLILISLSLSSLFLAFHCNCLTALCPLYNTCSVTQGVKKSNNN